MVFPKNLLSIDIGSEKIKIVELVKNKDKVTVKKALIINTPDDSIDDGQILNKQFITDVIEEELRKNNIKTKDVVFTLSCSKIITREVEYPNVKPKKLDAIIEMSVGDHFPVNLDDYNLTYTVEKPEKDAEDKSKVKVFMYAVQTDMINEYIELAKMIGLNIICIDYAGNSIVSFIRNEEIEGTNLFVEINSNNTMVTIISDGVGKFNRNLPYGNKIVSESIMNYYEVSIEEAAEIATKKPLLDSEELGNAYLSNDVSGAMDQILTGVSKLINYYSSRNKEKIEKIYLIGEGSKIVGIEEYISKFFNIDTEILKSLDSIEYVGEGDFSVIETYFLNAIGACYANINLLPKSMLEKSRLQSFKRLRYEIVILFVLIIGVVIYYQYSDIKKLEEKRDRLVSQVQLGRSATELKKEYEQLQSRKEFRQNILENSHLFTSYFLEILNIMEDTMPEDVFYLDINSSDTEITINCLAKDKMTVAKFIKTMKRLTYNEDEFKFTNVYVPAITELDNHVAFTITLEY